MNRRSEAMKNRKKGFFTLVEIIVAMAIMIFVFLRRVRRRSWMLSER